MMLLSNITNWSDVNDAQIWLNIYIYIYIYIYTHTHTHTHTHIYIYIYIYTQDVPRGKVNILGSHSIGHSKQKYL